MQKTIAQIRVHKRRSILRVISFSTNIVVCFSRMLKNTGLQYTAYHLIISLSLLCFIFLQ